MTIAVNFFLPNYLDARTFSDYKRFFIVSYISLLIKDGSIVILTVFFSCSFSNSGYLSEEAGFSLFIILPAKFNAP